MKPLIPMTLLLLSASAALSYPNARAQSVSNWTAAGQNLAEVAREERKRRNPERQPVLTYTSADLKPAPPTPEVVEAPKSEAVRETKPAEDPAKAWGIAIAELQAQIQKLKDQKTVLQNDLDAAIQQLYSPVTDSTAQREGQAKVAEIQKRLDDTQRDMTEAQSKLVTLAASGPTGPKN
jgi:predicted RNase H-like nuclease (RuvC/YqgF family)